MKYYKVVKTVKNRHYSVNVCSGDVIYGIPERLKYRVVEYKLNEWTRPSYDSKLFIFNDLKFVEMFVDIGLKEPLGPLAFYECEVVNPTKCYWVSLTTSIREFWRLCETRSASAIVHIGLNTRKAPMGTFTADAVKLTRKIEL
ncbi:MAG: hypothetical protein DWQ19_08970 [Crenarchaeota archaeon]|nr:MAG: hypothetical protein DWQ19_08970 [Thermoproteota archaeon]